MARSSPLQLTIQCQASHNKHSFEKCADAVTGIELPVDILQLGPAMKRDPSEPAEKKREKVLGYGQNKPLDAADR